MKYKEYMPHRSLFWFDTVRGQPCIYPAIELLSDPLSQIVMYLNTVVSIKTEQNMYGMTFEPLNRRYVSTLNPVDTYI